MKFHSPSYAILERLAYFKSICPPPDFESIDFASEIQLESNNNHIKELEQKLAEALEYENKHS